MVNAISIDSRSIRKGELFVAIKGEVFDGHDFVREALERGACGALVGTGFDVSGQMKQGEFFIQVDDTLEAYQDMAAYNRSESGAKVVAITGSSGKTTTKEMLRNIITLKEKDVVISEKNFNNYVGVPMTLLNIKDSHKIAVVEIGINQINEMERLAGITNPDIALVTNAGNSHLEFLHNVDTVAREKMKIADSLKKGGTLIFNCDDLRLLRSAREKDVGTMTFGFSGSADIAGTAFEDISLNKSRLEVSEHANPPVTIELKINGRHNAYNALAAFAAARKLDIPVNDIVRGLQTFEPRDMRSENIFLKNDIVIINDAYNANPDSMEASLKLFKDLKGAKRKIVVLGDMFELGEYSAKAHREVGAVVSSLNMDKMFFYGNGMKEAAKSAGFCGIDKTKIYWYNDFDALFESIYSCIQPGDWILVKGSRLNRLENIVERLVGRIGLNG